MSERVFLEDVGKLYSVNALGDAKAWELRHLRNDSMRRLGSCVISEMIPPCLQ